MVYPTTTVMMDAARSTRDESEAAIDLGHQFDAELLDWLLPEVPDNFKCAILWRAATLIRAKAAGYEASAVQNLDQRRTFLFYARRHRAHAAVVSAHAQVVYPSLYDDPPPVEAKEDDGGLRPVEFGPRALRHVEAIIRD